MVAAAAGGGGNFAMRTLASLATAASLDMEPANAPQKWVQCKSCEKWRRVRIDSRQWSMGSVPGQRLLQLMRPCCVPWVLL
jgi:hypothetical protein